MNLYCEVIREGISICIDNDVGYYHHLKVGEIFCIKDSKLSYIMDNKSKWKIGYKVSFVENWNRTTSKKILVGECIHRAFFDDITKAFAIKEERSRKLKVIGI